MRNAYSRNKAQKEELENYFANIRGTEMDIASDESVKNAIDSIISEDGKVDVLINSASPNPFRKMN